MWELLKFCKIQLRTVIVFLCVIPLIAFLLCLRLEASCAYRRKAGFSSGSYKHIVGHLLFYICTLNNGCIMLMSFSAGDFVLRGIQTSVY